MAASGLLDFFETSLSSACQDATIYFFDRERLHPTKQHLTTKFEAGPA